jgi:hypothetical protein
MFQVEKSMSPADVKFLAYGIDPSVGPHDEKPDVRVRATGLAFHLPAWVKVHDVAPFHASLLTCMVDLPVTPPPLPPSHFFLHALHTHPLTCIVFRHGSSIRCRARAVTGATVTSQQSPLFSRSSANTASMQTKGSVWLGTAHELF